MSGKKFHLQLEEQGNREERQHFLEDVLGVMPAGFMAFDESGKVTMINRLAAKWLKLPLESESAIGKDGPNLLSELPDLSDALRDLLKPPHNPITLPEWSLESSYFSIKGRAFSEGVLLVIENITKVKIAEQIALQSLLEGSEQEKRRLSKELHDGIGPDLSVLKHKLEGLILEESGLSSSNQSFQEALELIDEIAHDLREISHTLQPRTLRDFGLVAALENLVQKRNGRGKAVIQFFNNLPAERFELNIELNLFRITQELLQNALKHAKASSITVQLMYYDNHDLTLTVEDDGLGFEVKELNPEDGIGLYNIEARAVAMEGEFLIDSAPGRGTMATVTVQL